MVARNRAAKSDKKRQRICRNLSLHLVAFCRLLSLDAAFIFSRQFAILGRARVTPCQNNVFTARQNLAECCAKCFAWCQPSVDTLLPAMLLRMVPTMLLSMLRTLLLQMLPRVITTVLPRRCPPCCEAGANRDANQKNLLLWWCYWLIGAASEPLRLRVAGGRRWPAYWALWLPRRAAWRCWRIAGLLSGLR
jgi:hypothetical protein